MLLRNLTFSDTALAPFVPLGGGCSDNGDEVQSCTAGWQNSTFTAGTESLQILFGLGSMKDRG